MGEEMNIVEAIAKYNFNPAGDVTVPAGSDHPKFSLTEDWVRKGPNAKKTGLVYIWVKTVDGTIVDVAYVGKAGRTLKGRLSQHKGGFTDKTRVRKSKQSNSDKFQSWLGASPANGIKIYARHSPVQSVCDELVSMFSVEEEAFIQKFHNMGCNLWNYQAQL
jgi:hypothetical protein